MVMTWCKALARAILGRPRTEAPPEPPSSWRGEPLAAGGPVSPRTQSYRTLSIDDVPNDRANSPDPEVHAAPPETDAPEPAGLPLASSGSHGNPQPQPPSAQG
jgi:hypothetical protein